MTLFFVKRDVEPFGVETKQSLKHLRKGHVLEELDTNKVRKYRRLSVAACIQQDPYKDNY